MTFLPGRARPLAALVVLDAALLALSGVATTGAAQASLSVRGTVTRQTVAGEKIVAREQVTLHRVSSKEAGPVDSALTDAHGAFAFRVMNPDSSSMYLASTRYSGIAYFAQPVTVGQPAGVSPIIVYDTTSADVRVQLQGRHFVVSSPSAEGVRNVIDVLEVENDSVVTLVPGASDRATYSVRLPDGARNVRATQGEQADSSVRVREGRADIFAPLSPGLRQFVLTYELPGDVFPLAIALERPVAVLEVLLEEPGAVATAAGLANKGNVAVDGKSFTRFLGQSATANAVLTLTVPKGSVAGSLPPWAIPLVLTLVTLGAILVLARRSPVRPPTTVARASPPTPGRFAAASVSTAAKDALATSGATPSAGDTVTQLANRVAAIDALLARAAASPATPDSDLVQYRTTLKRELVDALAQGIRAG